MDSKFSIPSVQDEESAPPAYAETLPSYQAQAQTQTQAHPNQSPPSTSQYYSSQIHSQLQSITTQIKSTSTQKSLLSHAKEEQILALLTTQIQLYLSDFAKTGLHRGTLILIPEKGLQDDSAVPVDYDFRDEGEYDRVVRVGGKEADEYAGEGEVWFWRDEDMARRLASYLRPVRDMRNQELPPRNPVVMPDNIAPSASRVFWGRKRSSSKAAERPALIEERMDSKMEFDTRQTIAASEDKVLMDIRAEEVVFRTENSFGIYETQRGWGIVLKFRVTLGR